MIRHAIKMIGRTFRSYALLSVTVVLSFALLLGYLAYTDSSLYNEYKDIFSQDRNTVYVWSATVGDPKFQVLKEQSQTLPDTDSYTEYAVNLDRGPSRYVLEDGTQASLPPTEVRCIPAHCWGLYENTVPITVQWLDGAERDTVSLRSGEIIMEQQLFQLLGLEDSEDPVYTLTLYDPDHGNTVLFRKDMRVVGTYAVPDNPPITEQALAMTGTRDLGLHSIFCPMADLNPGAVPGLNWYEIAHYVSASPEKVYQLAMQLNFAEGGGGLDAVCEQQNRALVVKQAENRTKAIIAAALLVLLGINLYSAFSNALNDRKFEIGVKRALGASAWSIVRQFLYESLLVMLANLLISVALVGDILLIYKIIYEHTPDAFGRLRDWIIYLSPYSVGMFGACAISLTVSFSLIFSWKSTQVEIVQYLKAE